MNFYHSPNLDKTVSVIHNKCKAWMLHLDSRSDCQVMSNMR